MNDRIVYHQQVSFCGKARCRKCREGIGHGPYWYAYRMQNGHTTRTYVGKQLPPDVHIVQSSPSTTTPTAIPIAVAERSEFSDTHMSEGTMPFVRTHQSPLIGRKQEWEALHTMMLNVEQYASERARVHGQRKVGKIEALPFDTRRSSQCILLTGEPGIGKTRLAEEMSLEAQRRNWLVLWSRVYSQESSVPYRLWIEVLRKAMGYGVLRQNMGGREHLPVQLQPLAALLPELQTLMTPPSSGNTAKLSVGETSRASTLTVTSTPEQEQLRLWEATHALLTIISENMPLLIVLDDLQWADSSSCEMLAYLARHLHDSRILMLGTYRENEVEKHPLRHLVAHMQRERTLTTLHIEPLTREEIGTLIGRANLPETVVRHIQAQSSGNPFFAEELALSTPPTLPKTITATLESRIDRLSVPCQNMLGNAAVLGGSFELPVILAIEVGSNAADEDILFDLLEEALHAHVLTEESEGTHVTYSFWHPLLVSHLYKRISAARRMRVHQRAATILRRMYKGHEEEVAATIAHHLKAGGAEPTEIVHYAGLAGDRAYALSAFTEAAQQYQIAVDTAPGNILPPIRYEHSLVDTTSDSSERTFAYLLERLAECMMILGEWQEARRLFERIVAAHTMPEVHGAEQALPSEKARRDEAQIQALLWGEIGRTWRYEGNKAEAKSCCERGEEVLRKNGIDDGPAWAKLRYQHGGLYWQEGQYELAWEATQEALNRFKRQASQKFVEKAAVVTAYHARSTRVQRTLEGDPVDLGRTHAQLGLIANSMGELGTAQVQLQTALTIFEQYNQEREIAHVLCNSGHVHLTRGEYDLAQTALRRSLGLAERVGDDPLCSVIFSNLGELAVTSNNMEEAEVWYRRGLSLAERFNDREYMSRWNVNLASVLQEQGKLDEAAERVVQALSIGRAMHSNPCIGNALVGLGSIRIAQARAVKQLPNVCTRLLTHARENVQRTRALDGVEVEASIRGRFILAQVLLLSGETDRAREELQAVIAEAHRHELSSLERAAKNVLHQEA